MVCVKHIGFEERVAMRPGMVGFGKVLAKFGSGS